MNIIFMPISVNEGMAGTQRLQNYLKHLTINKVQFYNISFSTSKRQNSYDHENVFYYNYRLKQFFLQFYIIKTLIIKKKASESNFIYNYGYISINNIFGLIAARIIGYKIVLDIVEDIYTYDSNISFLSKLLNKTAIFFFNYIYLLTDGVIVISNYLERLTYSKTKGKTPIIKIPITTNPKDYKTNNESLDSTIFYGGSFSPKDGLGNLLQAIEILNTDGIDCKLVITGKGLQADMDIFFDKMNSLKHKQKIIYKGYVSRQEYISTLSSCSILCMTRINSKFANAGFPFKLGEMLSTGKPVIATNTGEVKNYLSHNIDAIIIEPDNIDELVVTIKHLILNQKRAFEIGKNGKALAEREFDSQIHTDRLIDFLKSI